MSEGLDALRERRPVAVFLDDGGVLNDNELRAPEWRRLIGEFMPPRLGGTAEQWEDANVGVFKRVWDGIVERLPEFESHAEFQHDYATGWVRGMCERLGIAAPSDDDAMALYRELSIYIGERATCEIAGAADAVRSLHRAGYRLFMASGTTSWELRAITTKMGIGEVFSGFCGPDLVDHVKYGRAFYERVFAHAGVAPESALVIESDEQCCEWAREAGARAAWADPEGRGAAESLAKAVASLI